MKKTPLLILFMLGMSMAQAQSYKKSKFLYGQAKESSPYSLGFYIGNIEKSQLATSDFIQENKDFAFGCFIEKPLNYRFAILTDLRLIGDINGENLNTKYALHNSYDISCALKYLMVDKSYGKISMSAGIGILNRSTHIESAMIDTNSTNQANVVFPITIYYSKPISKRIDATILYRNYWSLSDDIDAVRLNKNNDQYQLITIGLSYHFGNKNYRFKKQNTCPAQQ
ncbi:MAG: hypothetical protein ACOVJ4_04280 [Sphingobacteriaceae bacterium]